MMARNNCYRACFFAILLVQLAAVIGSSSKPTVTSVTEGSRELVPPINVLSLPRFTNGVNVTARHQDIRISSRNKNVDFFKVDQRGFVVASDIDLETMCSSNGLCCMAASGSAGSGSGSASGSFGSSSSTSSAGSECGTPDGTSCCIELWLFPPETSSHDTVFVKINDLNEFVPHFENSHEDVQVAENQRVSIHLPLPIDEDYAQKSLFIFIRGADYQIFSDRQPIRLDGSLSRITLNLGRELDREVRDSYNFTVLACETERLVQQRCGSLNVTLTVQDVNDNPPRFNVSARQANFSVRETDGSEEETHIATLVAHDRDEGENAHVIYRLENEPKCIMLGSAIGSACRARDDRQSDRLSFEIRSAGDLVAVGPLDYEECRKYSLIVRAANSAPSTYTDTIEVIVQVTDVDDTRPCVKWVPDSRAKLLENSATQQELSSFVSVSDLDTPLQRISCEVHPSEYFRLRASPTKSGSDFTSYGVVATRAFDREAAATVTVEVRCSDRAGGAGEASFSDAAMLDLEVLDVNDNAPVFVTEGNEGTLSNTIVAHIDENEPTGTWLYRLVATDRDANQNADIEYTFANRSAYQMLNLDAASGNLTSASQFDFETKPEYRFVVLATDRGAPRNTGSATLIVRVSDVNDNPPEFSKQKYEFRVQENAPPNLLVGTVVAHDRDSKPAITYRILESQDHFLISSEKGDIVVYNPLDRESMQSDRYVLTVIANDSMHTATTLVEIVIEDQNDREPRFVHPTPENSTLRFACPRSNQCVGMPGCTVTHVRTVDDDASPSNTHVMYGIKSSTQPEAFHINAETGELFYRHDASRGCLGLAKLTIEARDPRNPSLASTLDVSIVFFKDDQRAGAGRGGSADGLSRAPPAYDNTSDGVSEGGFITTHQLMIILVVSAVFVVCAIGLLLVLLSRMHVRKRPLQAGDMEDGQQHEDCDPNDTDANDDSRSQMSSHDGDSLRKEDDLHKQLDHSEYGGTMSVCSEVAHDRSKNPNGRTESPYFSSKSQPLSPMKRGLIVPRRAERTLATMGASRQLTKPSGTLLPQPYVYYSVLNGTTPNRTGCESPVSHTTNSCIECSVQHQFAVKMRPIGSGNNNNNSIEDEHAYASAGEFDPTCACPECMQVRSLTAHQFSTAQRSAPPAFKLAAVHTVPLSGRYNVPKPMMPPVFNTIVSSPTKGSVSSGLAGESESDRLDKLLVQHSDGYLTTMARARADGNNNGDADKKAKQLDTVSGNMANHTAACPPDCTNPRCLVSYV